MLIRLGKVRYAWVTAAPALFVYPIVVWAGYLNVTTNFMPKGLYLLATLSVVLMVLITIVFIAAFHRWYSLLKADQEVVDAYGDRVLALAGD